MSKVTAPPKVTLIFYPSILNPESNGYAESSDPSQNGGPFKRRKKKKWLCGMLQFYFKLNSVTPDGNFA